MTHGRPIAIFPASNGFVVVEENEAMQRGDSARILAGGLVCRTMDELHALVEAHFRATACPRCRSRAERSEYMLFMEDIVVVRCGHCRLVAVEGVDMEWLPYAEGRPGTSIFGEDLLEELRRARREAINGVYRPARAGQSPRRIVPPGREAEAGFRGPEGEGRHADRAG